MAMTDEEKAARKLETLKIDAMYSLRPNAKWSYSPETGFVWEEGNTETQPTDAELVAEIPNIEYKFHRIGKYPQLEEQLDMLWHAIDSGTLDKTCDFYTTMKAVKDDYPKGYTE